jgi:hypothetical protein
MTHALLDGYDNADEASFARAIGSSFVLLDEERIRERDGLLSSLRARRARGAPARTRTYRDEHTWIGTGSAVYFGEAVEHYPPDGAGLTGDFDGWSTVVWIREAGVWRAASWQWIKGGLDAARQEWNETYREGRDFNPQPNKFLAEMVNGRRSGLALDVAMGQGRNALYLASQGWRVTGIDISDEACVRRARPPALANSKSMPSTPTWTPGLTVPRSGIS